MELLTRDEFRNSVFERDKHKCVVCAKPAADAHHIIERRLFDNGGYYLENGASLCTECHWLAEQTVLSCEEIREKAGIEKVVLPPQLYRDHSYDKWGNLILPNGQRCKGELFFDTNVNKILSHANIISLFTDYVKYPRTYHLPWSEGATKDDRFIENLDRFIGNEVVVLTKMDGENSNFYSDYYHARSINSDNHWSRNWAKNFHARIKYDIPNGWRVCAENLYAKHSIKYDSLKSFVLVFSIWNESNECLSWDNTVEWCELIGLDMVPVLYRGIFNEDLIRSLFVERDSDGNEMEGYVVRIASSFKYEEFKRCVAKFVRRNHVQTSHNWKSQCEKNSIINY